MVGTAYTIVRDVARALPRIAKWFFFEEENAVMWTFFVLIMAISANLTAYSVLQATPAKEHTGIILTLTSPVWALIIFRFFFHWTVIGRGRARIEFIKDFGKLRDTVRLKNGWLVGIYEINGSFYVVPLEEVSVSEWKKFERLFRDLRAQKEAYDLEATRKLLAESF